MNDKRNVLYWIFYIIENAFQWLSTIPIPGFRNVSLLQFSLALIVMSIVISGTVNVVSNQVSNLGVDLSTRISDSRSRHKEARAERREQRQVEDDIDTAIKNSNSLNK